MKYLLLFVGLALTGCQSVQLPSQSPVGYSGVLSGVRSDLVLERSGNVVYADLRMRGGSAGRRSVVGPVEVTSEVLDPRGGTSFVPVIFDSSGRIVPAGYEADRVISTRFVMHVSTTGQKCELRMQLNGSFMRVHEVACGYVSQPLSYDGVLHALPLMTDAAAVARQQVATAFAD